MKNVNIETYMKSIGQNSKPQEADLDSAIAHCKEIISKMDNCPCKKDHEILLYFLEELKFRREHQNIR